MKKNIVILLVCTTILIGIISGCVQEEEPTPTNTAPVVSFTYDIEHNTKFDGGIVTFNATATDKDNDVLTYSWDFDDGETSTLEDPVHEYAINGSYTVTLTVNDTKDETTKTETIIVGNIAPVARFTWSAVNLTVTFTDASSDINKDDLTYAWDFDDDGIPDNETAGPVVYTFAAAGSYNVTLTVTDFWGLVDSNMLLITVEEGLYNITI